MNNSSLETMKAVRQLEQAGYTYKPHTDRWEKRDGFRYHWIDRAKVISRPKEVIESLKDNGFTSNETTP